MRRDAPRIGVEVILVGLVLASLAGALGLVIRAHRSVVKPPVDRPSVVAVVEPTPVPEVPEPPAPTPPEPSPIDLTPARLAAIDSKVAEKKAHAEAAERKASDLEKAANEAETAAATWEERTRTLQAEVTDREIEADRAESERDALARERDALIEHKDALKTNLELRKLKARDGVAVLPYKGSNGTWRRPIAIECANGAATMRPGGPGYTLNDMAEFGDPRTNPLVLAVAKAMVRTRSIATPDGAGVEPYILFIVRPDGIRPYYAARTILEPLGIAYGYELADANWDIEFPDLNDPSEWTDNPKSKKSPTWPPPPSATEVRSGNSPRNGARVGSGMGSPGWPNDRGGAGGLATEGGVVAGDAPRPGASRSGQNGQANGTGLVEGGGVGASGRSEWRSGSELEDAPSEGSLSGSGRSGLQIPGPIGQRGGPGAGLAPSPSGIADGLRQRGGQGNGLVPDTADPTGRGQGEAVYGKPGLNGPGLHGSDGASRPEGRGANPGQGAGGGSGSRTSPVKPGSGDGGGTGLPGEGRGRPGQPGRGEGLPSFEPAPPSGENPLEQDGQPGGLSPRNAGRSLSDRIAMRHGLVAPTMPRVPNRTAGEPPLTVGGSAVPDPRRSGGAGSSGGESAVSPSGEAGGGLAGEASGTPGQPGSGSGSGGSGEGNGGSGSGWSQPGLRSRSLPITVACDRNGATVHPGGLHVPIDAMTKDDMAFPAKLRGIVAANQAAEPEVGFRPRVTFLVKPGGETTYLKARWQTSFGTNYPQALRVVEPGAPKLPGLEAR